eukprot:CAMPEP_0177720908 /NCGR_PEP_ID=MMETSP0484_2-20121128/16864_1 /TAXON_ID=354590 /ORGANISM="Rhodomonas lens, Strain RHODO" /LENGTH=484 /DNA_ID=CAMNT_0019233177 /DNA_START=20 /DNA_END=1474 /DNA_ORIENTATION=+
MSSHRRSLTACVMAACFVGFCSAFVPTSLPVRSGLAPAALSSAAVGGRMRLPIAPARCQLRRGALQLRAGADDWARTERVTFEGDTLAYTEEVEGAEVGVAQAKVPLSAEQPYYEVTVEDGGTQSWIGVGIATNDYPLDKQPGWEQSSVGYHADDGMYYRSPVPDQMSKSGRPNPLPLNAQPMPCQKGDVMGIGLEFDTRGQMASGMPRRVYFVRNGEYLGSVLLERNFHEAVYPTVGFNSPGAKVNVNLKADPASAQILHAAQQFGSNEYAIDILEDALNAGADVNGQDAAGRTALHMAAAYGVGPIASLLIDKGADPDVQDKMGLTPMHMAAGYVRPTTVKLLIENGADPELRTARNERPLDIIRNLRNGTKESSLGGLVTDKRYPLMTEIMELIEAVTEDTAEWVVPAPPKLEPEQEEAMKNAMDKAKNLVEEMKKDPEKMKELEKAMELMKDKEFQEKVKKYANDPEGMSKLIEDYKDKV